MEWIIHSMDLHIRIFKLRKEEIKMREELFNLLKEEYPDVDFQAENLVDDGIMDSITMVGVIGTISMEYGIQIPYEEIVAENFNSLDAMVALVESLRKTK